MPVTLVEVRHRRKVDYGVTAGSTTIMRQGRDLWRRFMSQTKSSLLDSNPDSEYALAYTDTDPAVANTGLALSGGSGAVGATLAGVAVTATWATSDTNSAALIAAAINSSSTAKVKGMFRSSNLTATITCSGVTAGDTVDVCGSRFTATTGVPVNSYSGAYLAAFDRSGSDAATATALAAAINNFPGLSRFVFAVPVSNVVRLFARQFVYTVATNTFSWPVSQGGVGSDVPSNVLVSSTAARLALSGSSLAAGAFVGIAHVLGGVFGNQVAVAASGTGVSVLNGETYLMRGTGLDGGVIIDNC
jgi:hypothetical protein